MDPELNSGWQKKELFVEFGCICRFEFHFMFNDNAHLSPHIFSAHMPEEATRDGYGKGLVEIGRLSEVIVLTADLAESTRCHWFKSVYPERFIECGVAEQNMAAVAAGLAVSGKIPFINSYAVFSPGRNWEQIRTTVAYNNANVKIAGHHAGISTGPDGATHQALEDIALMRALPNMRVVYPADALEAQKAAVAAASVHGPVYIRLHREASPVFTTHETPFVFGGASVLWESAGTKTTGKPKAVIFSTGPMSYEALHAARMLQKEKISAAVVHVPTIKPLDEKTIVEWAKKTGAVVTAEEHSLHGGFGSAVAEVLAEKFPVPIEFVGVRDQFGQSGSAHELADAYNLQAKDIVIAAKRVLRRKL
jgi:transketolase